MNELPLNAVEEEVGPTASEGLTRLSEFLGNPVGPLARMAQSIITRSEAGLFGLSMPRFAVRVYLEKGGFVNCRRLATLERNFHLDNSLEWGHRYADSDIRPKERSPDLEPLQCANKPINQVLQNQSCIADSLLPEPERLRRYGFRYLDISQARLPEAYGEESLLKCPSAAMPYVTNTSSLGGGLCAQAVSFMATTTLAHLAKLVCGIAEITCYAHDPDCLELSLGGLTLESMRRYFDFANLNASEQCVTIEPRTLLGNAQKRTFASVLRCYLQSGLPVILPSDMYRLATSPTGAKSVYARNGLLVSRDELLKNEGHAVMVTGYTRKENDLFVFNDPGTMPFLVASKEELCTVGASRAGLEAPDNGLLMPVTPAAVRMPLLDQRVYNSDDYQVIDIKLGLDVVSRLGHFFFQAHCPAQPNLVDDRFHLIRSDSPLAQLDQIAPDHRNHLEYGLLRIIEKLEKQLSWSRPHWLWVEVFPNSLWVWDAEVEPPTSLPEDWEQCSALIASNYLLGYTQIDEIKNELLVTV